MTNRLLLALASVAAMGIAPAVSAEIYIRKGDQEIEVVDKDGALWCTRKSDGYEMCNGMAKTGDFEYAGKTMKHPDMPGFMTFNGTVTIGQNALKIEGCALGMCDAEVWNKP